MDIIRELPEQLDRTERCDECGAQAYYHFEAYGTWLKFCGHHGTKHETKLLPVSTNYKDLRYLIDAP